MNTNDPEAPPANPLAHSVRVWDLPTRLFHWLTVGLVVAAYVTIRLNLLDWHVLIGKTLLALVLFRLFWGCIGSETARFRGFVASPAAALRHLQHLFRREPDLQMGHNPVGGWMVLLLLGLLLGETITGIYDYNDVSDVGPLTAVVPAPIAYAISRLHDSLLWDAIVVAVALHLLAIALYAAVKGHNLLRPMLTGRKTVPARIREPRRAPLTVALVLLIVAAAVVTALAKYM
ncbi:cytochrome b/b6 domain-containing protein [Trinickia dinghuensis]|uniref:Hydrogenase n=1 Tax=Trinickia dinghuensis TaxID=2291023 RepID=A0A3D8JXE1_9BURK|nr:cytochrome b/b6 domain-containing protein [Trinickia dinghuensis]RDU97305.1 hydrogenase [Trinickia dinghuensis]